MYNSFMISARYYNMFIYFLIFSKKMSTQSINPVQQFFDEGKYSVFCVYRKRAYITNEIYPFTIADLFKYYSTSNQKDGFRFRINKEISGRICYDSKCVYIAINENHYFDFPLSNTISRSKLNKQLSKSVFVCGNNTLCLSILHKVFNPLVYEQWERKKVI